MVHANARLTPHGRWLLVQRVRVQGRPVAHVARELGVSRQCAYRWVARFDAEGRAGLVDRSSRPHRFPTASDPQRVAAVLAARARLRRGPDELARATGVPARTVSRILRRAGVPYLWQCDPVTGQRIRAAKTTAVRYEHAHPGDLVHVDVKKIGRIPPGGGWRLHGRAAGDTAARKRARIGFDFVHAAVDDYSRVAYAEVLPDEKGTTCAGFIDRALTHFAALGAPVHAVITDNHWSYTHARDVDLTLAVHGAEHWLIKAHCPWQNGKVERFNRTLATEWATDSPGSPTTSAPPPSPAGCASTTLSATTTPSAPPPSPACHQRDGPVQLALGFLADGQESALVEAAGRVARLTHWEDDNADATAIWSLAIRHAIRTGDLDVPGQVQWIPAERRERWRGFVEEALAPGKHPRDFSSGNGWVVRAFQGALAAVAGATSLVDALERAVRGGNDTDTVAAIAGSLTGAVHGATAVPLSWQRILHGWPDLRTNDLTRLAVLAARRGTADDSGWPTVEAMPTAQWLHTAARRHPHDDGVWLGSQSALGELPDEVDAVVSLSRIGTDEIPADIESIRVWLIDTEGHNANLDFVLAEAADAIADLRAEGHRVFVHCAEARSRTAAVAALYGARHRGVPLDDAWIDIRAALPHYAPAEFHRRAVARIVTQANVSATSEGF